MTTKFLHQGLIMPFTAPSGGVTVDTPVLIGGLLVLPIVTASEGDTFNGYVTGVWTGIAKETGQAWSEGDKLYWDNGNSRLTTDAIDGMLVGVAAADATSGATTGDVRMNGSAPALSEGPQTNVADLTENSGAIGGTNDGDLPDLSGSPAGTDAAFVTALIAAVRELAADNNALKAALRNAGVMASS